MKPRGDLESIHGSAHVLGDNINTDLHCTSKYRYFGKDLVFLADHAFQDIAPTLTKRIQPGDVIVAGNNFGINSSREQAVQVLLSMGIGAIVARSFGRQFFRNAINNGLPVINCSIDGIASGDELVINLETGCLNVPARTINRRLASMPPAILAILSAGGLIPFLKLHPDWEV